MFGNKGRGINLDDPSSVYAFHLSDVGEGDLNGDGVIDLPDADTGANQLQNAAVVTNVSFTSSTKTIT